MKEVLLNVRAEMDRSTNEIWFEIDSPLSEDISFILPQIKYLKKILSTKQSPDEVKEFVGALIEGKNEIEKKIGHILRSAIDKMWVDDFLQQVDEEMNDSESDIF